MLLKDGEKVDLKNNEEFKEAKKWIKENLGFPVIFKAHPSYLTEEVKSDGRGNVIGRETRMCPIRLPNKVHEKTEDGTVTWQYCPITPPKKDGEYLINPKHQNTWFFDKVFRLGEEDMEQLFFLYYKNPQFKTYFVVDDAKAQAKTNVDQKVKEAKIYNAFYGKDSILLKNEEKLRDIARSCHIAQVNTKSREQVLNELETRVRERDTMGVQSIDDFIDSLDLDYYTQVGVVIQKAEDKDLIRFDDRSSCWFYVTSDKTLGDKIVQVKNGRYDHRYEDLREYMFGVKEHIARLTSLVDAKDVSQQLEINIDDLENEDWNKILAYCNKNGIATVGRGRTKAMVFEDIRKLVKG